MHRAALTLALFCSACEAPAPADAGSPSLDAGRDAASDAAFVCAADRECDDGVFCDGPERCVDARCVEGSPPCDAALETCDAVAETCSPIDCSVPDRDGDGHRSIACGGGDCDDDDAARNPGVMEVCDVADVDEDCDPSTYGVRDADMDDEPDARCCNGEVCGTDCDDMRAGVSPRVPEVCGNGLDDDCDGRMDEELLVDGFVDDDGDGWGDDARPMRACAGAEGFAARGGDCDDGDPDVSPGASEACDGVDNNCSGVVDEGLPSMMCYEDLDGDGYGQTASTSMRCACGSGWAVLPGDCADWNADARPTQSWRDDCYCTNPPPATCTGCGFGSSTDWNCDGTVERRWPTAVFGAWCYVQGTPPTATCAGAGQERWETTVPSCLVEGWLLRCRSDCTIERRRVTQGCR